MITRTTLLEKKRELIRASIVHIRNITTSLALIEDEQIKEEMRASLVACKKEIISFNKSALSGSSYGTFSYQFHKSLKSPSNLHILDQEYSRAIKEIKDLNLYITIGTSLTLLVACPLVAIAFIGVSDIFLCYLVARLTMITIVPLLCLLTGPIVSAGASLAIGRAFKPEELDNLFKGLPETTPEKTDDLPAFCPSPA